MITRRKKRKGSKKNKNKKKRNPASNIDTGCWEKVLSDV